MRSSSIPGPRTISPLAALSSGTRPAIQQPNFPPPSAPTSTLTRVGPTPQSNVLRPAASSLPSTRPGTTLQPNLPRQSTPTPVSTTAVTRSSSAPRQVSQSPLSTTTTSLRPRAPGVTTRAPTLPAVQPSTQRPLSVEEMRRALGASGSPFTSASSSFRLTMRPRTPGPAASPSPPRPPRSQFPAQPQPTQSPRGSFPPGDSLFLSSSSFNLLFLLTSQLAIK